MRRSAWRFLLRLDSVTVAAGAVSVSGGAGNPRARGAWNYRGFGNRYLSGGSLGTITDRSVVVVTAGGQEFFAAAATRKVPEVRKRPAPKIGASGVAEEPRPRFERASSILRADCGRLASPPRRSSSSPSPPPRRSSSSSSLGALSGQASSLVAVGVNVAVVGSINQAFMEAVQPQ